MMFRHCTGLNTGSSQIDRTLYSESLVARLGRKAVNRLYTEAVILAGRMLAVHAYKKLQGSTRQ